MPGPRAPRLVEALGQRRPTPVVQARPRTGSGDLGHGTACPRRPNGVPAPGPVTVPTTGKTNPSSHRTCPPVPADRVRTVAARECVAGTASGAHGRADVLWDGGLREGCAARQDVYTPAPAGPGGARRECLARPAAWTDTTCRAAHRPAWLTSPTIQQKSRSTPRVGGLPPRILRGQPTERGVDPPRWRVGVRGVGRGTPGGVARGWSGSWGGGRWPSRTRRGSGGSRAGRSPARPPWWLRDRAA